MVEPLLARSPIGVASVSEPKRNRRPLLDALRGPPPSCYRSPVG